MESTIEQNDNATVIHFIGSIDASCGPEATSLLEQQVRDGHHQLVLNLSQVDFMSSAGIRCILNTIKLTRAEGGDLRLAQITPSVEKVLDLGGITSVVQVFPDNQSALESFAS